MKKLYYLLAAMRPQQWTKNLVVFAGLIFSRNLSNPQLIYKSVQAFLVFCALSGVIYVINDVADIDRDKLHEVKKKRPLPSGKLGVREAITAVSIIAAVTFFFAWHVGTSFFIVAILFFALNIAYTFSLKHMALLDVMGISISFVLRAIAGVEALNGVVSSVEISPWLLICTLFLALFLGFCKRRHELLSLEFPEKHRESLADYSALLIDQLVGISAAGAILSYSLYTIWPDTVAHFGTTRLVYTIPLVILGVMRYLYLVYRQQKGGNPSEIFLHEKFILIDVFVWTLLVVAICYVF